MYFEISVSFSRKSFKSAKSRHSEDSELVRQVFIVQKIIPVDMISYKKLLVNFFSDQTLFKSKRYLLDEMFQQNASKGPISISGDKTRMEHPLFFPECYQFFFHISISKDFYLHF